MSEVKKGWRITIGQLGLLVTAFIWVMVVLIIGVENATFNGWMLLILYMFFVIFPLQKKREADARAAFSLEEEPADV